MSPSLPPPEEHGVPMADGTRLHVERHLALSPRRGALVFLHGFAMHVGPYRHVAAAFAEAGFDVTAFDCRGHGRSEGRRGYVRRFSDFVDDLEEILTWTRAREAPGAPVVVAAHSHGGTIALCHALARRSAVSALLLGAPWLGLTMKVPFVKRAAAPILSRLWPTLALGNGIRVEDITRDPQVQAALAPDPLIHHVATSRWFTEALSAHAHILAGAARLDVPTFIALPGRDRIASTETTAAFVRAAAAAGAPVEAQTYPETFHEVFLEPERAEIIAYLVSRVVPRLKARIL